MANVHSALSPSVACTLGITMPIRVTFIRPHAVAWAPALAIVACLGVAGAGAWLGHRQLVRQAHAQLATAAGFVSGQLEAEFRVRLRALESLAAVDAADPDAAHRVIIRREVVDTLARLHPELVWVGVALLPGRVTVARDAPTAGTDVSQRDWWVAGLRGPYLGSTRETVRPRPAVPAAAPADASTVPVRVLDIAVPLRDAAGTSYGVLAAKMDVAWLAAIREALLPREGPMAGAEIVVLERDRRIVSGQRELVLRGDPLGQVAGVAVSGSLDGSPRVFGGHAIDGDVAVSRLGWSVLVAQDLDVLHRPARRFVAQALAVGALAAVLLSGALGGLLRRRPAP
jgi:hypothetical protein